MKHAILLSAAISCACLAIAQPYVTVSAGAARCGFSSRGIDSQVLPSLTAAAAASYRLGIAEAALQPAFHQYGASISQREGRRLNIRADYLNIAALIYLHLPAEEDHAVAIGVGPHTAISLGHDGERLSGISGGFFLRWPWFQLSGQVHRGLSGQEEDRFSYYTIMLGLPLRLSP